MNKQDFQTKIWSLIENALLQGNAYISENTYEESTVDCGLFLHIRTNGCQSLPNIILDITDEDADWLEKTYPRIEQDYRN